MSRSGPAAPRRLGLSVVLVRYDRSKYAGVWKVLSSHLRSLYQRRLSVVIVDNAKPPGHHRQIENGVFEIGGDNTAWEFSAFDRGLDWLDGRGQLFDMALLATDALGASGYDFLGLSDRRLAEFCRDRGAVAGWIDSFMEESMLLGERYQAWFSTRYLLSPTSVLERVRPLAWPIRKADFFSGDWRRPWRKAAPLSPELAARLQDWLVGPDAATTLHDRWHSRFELSPATLGFFEAKICAILREHHLSMRLAATEAPRFDLRVLADLVAGGPGLEAEGAAQYFGGLESMLADSTAPPEREPAVAGRRVMFGGDIRSPESLGVARGFASEIMPLVRQRYPDARFEVAASGGGRFAASVATLDGAVVTPLREFAAVSAQEIGALVVPRGEGSGTLAFCRKGPRWAQVERIPIDDSFMSPTEGPVAVAASCCEALARWVPPPPSPEEPESPPPWWGDGFETRAFRWSLDYRAWRESVAEEYQRREEHQAEMVGGRRRPFLINGLCYACSCETSMHVDFEFGGDRINLRPNWRERTVCQVCGLNSKMRGVLHVLGEVVVPPPNARVGVWELGDEMYEATRGRYGAVRALGEVSAISSEACDCLVVLDMLEGATDLDETVGACFSALSPGGGMVFTAAFWSDRERTRAPRAVGTTGVLREFGWSLLDVFREAGFEDVVAHFFWTPTFGYLGTEQVVFVARKGQSAA